MGCLLATGCGRSAEEKLQGTWEYSALERTAPDGNSPSGGGLADFVRGVAQAAGMKVGMEFHFNADHTATVSASFIGTTTSGPLHWKVTHTDGDAMTVELRNADGQVAMSLDVTWIDDDHIRLAPPALGGREVEFTRVRRP